MYALHVCLGSAITHGISHILGDVAVGKLADLVMWKPANFGVRPEQIIKGGVIAWAAMGDANAVSVLCYYYWASKVSLTM